VSDSQIQSRTVVCSLYNRITAAHLEQDCLFWPGSGVVNLFIHFRDIGGIDDDKDSLPTAV
jgi:hypothetical protein